MANKSETQEFMQDSSIIPALPYRIPMPPGAAVPMRHANGDAPDSASPAPGQSKRSED